MIHAYQKPLKGKSIGIVLGSFAPLHQGHLDEIFKAKKENDGGCIVIVCGYEGDKGGDKMPLAKRYRYVREFFKDDDLVAVYSISDDELGIAGYNDQWDTWLTEFENIWNKAVDVQSHESKRIWYVGEKNYKEALEERNEKAVLLDRKQNPISATMIRNNPLKYWDKITYPFKRVFSTNILITGTASEGKTTLTKDLGKYFNSPYSHEWARDYMIEHTANDPELDGVDFLAFLQGQYDLNKKLINSKENNGIFFSDTDPIVTKMYAEYYTKEKEFNLTKEEYKVIEKLADELTKKSKWDKIFLIIPHGIFVNDNTRYMGHSDIKERQNLYNLLVKNLKKANLWDKVTILDGNYYENFIKVVDYVKGIKDE